MSRPKAYDPEYGCMYQMFWKLKSGDEWEHCDYAKDRHALNYLMQEYRIAYNCGEMKAIQLPKKYWAEKEYANL